MKLIYVRLSGRKPSPQGLRLVQRKVGCSQQQVEESDPIDDEKCRLSLTYPGHEVHRDQRPSGTGSRDYARNGRGLRGQLAIIRDRAGLGTIKQPQIQSGGEAQPRMGLGDGRRVCSIYPFASQGSSSIYVQKRFFITAAR
jgi:hypothetical protein